MDSFFAQLSDSVATARTLEDLSRPLLEMLEAVTGLESTYLTTIDLDGFKQVNDAHGHDAGDQLLRAIATGMEGALRGGDVLARVGGDEFVVLGLGPKLDTDGTPVARLLQERLASATIGRYAAGAVSIEYTGASVGVACLDPHQIAAEQVLRESDAAMYRVKLARRQQG